jgi:RNA polymerase sigma factor (sigma-70 family)
VKQYSLEQLLEGIKSRNNQVLTFIYREYYPLIESFVIQNQGNDDDAKDVFQEAIISLYKYVTESNFRIEKTFKTYIYSVCRFIWLKQLRSRRIHLKNVVEMDEPESVDHPSEENINEELEMSLYRKHFMELEDECREILELSLEKVPYDEIAKKMGFKSEKFVRNRRFRCKEALIKRIKNDPEYKEIESLRSN